MNIKALKIFTAGLGGHQDFLISDVRRWRLISDKRQDEMVDKELMRPFL
jgi:hypothetical protein